MENNKAIKPFGFKDKIGYMFGDFGNDLTFLLSSSFLLKFYTDVMDVDAYVVGIIMMIARFVDAFTDVAMGRICDKSKMTPAGKFKPWIRRMCGPVAIVSFLMYQSSLSGLPKPAKIAYLFITYILWGSVFILQSIFLTAQWLLLFPKILMTGSHYPLSEQWAAYSPVLLLWLLFLLLFIIRKTAMKL